MAALPFCHVTLKGHKPKPAGYPAALVTIGDHIRRRRMDLELDKKDVAHVIGVSVFSIIHWEMGLHSPEIRFMPAVIRFLGYHPDSKPTSLAERMLAVRRGLGITQRPLGGEH